MSDDSLSEEVNEANDTLTLATAAAAVRALAGASRREEPAPVFDDQRSHDFIGGRPLEQQRPR